MNARQLVAQLVERHHRRRALRPGRPESAAPLYGCAAVVLSMLVPAGTLAVIAWLSWLADR